MRQMSAMLCLACLLGLFLARAGHAANDATGDIHLTVTRTGICAAPPPPLVSLLPEPLHAATPRPLIAIIIDDVGVDQKRSARAVAELAPEVTMSYLAYAPHIREQVASAQEKGHPIMLHLPWEPDSAHEDPGPHHLSVTMPEAVLAKNLAANLDGFSGYTGVNNHMGSKFSRYRAGLELVMDELKKRHVFYLDSKTTPRSIAEKVAREKGLPTTHRDVFIDDDNAPAAVAAQIREIERVARCHGSAVAIGHPRDATLAALKAWLPTLQDRGFTLATTESVIDYRAHAAAIASKE